MQILEYRGTKLYPANALLDRSGVQFGKKTFEHLRDTLHLIPRPFKIPMPNGGGTIGYYPDMIVDLLRDVQKQHEKGNSYPKLAQALANKHKEAIEKAEELKDGYESEKRLQKQLLSENLMVVKHPGDAIKTPVMIVGKTRSGKLRLVESADLLAKKKRMLKEVKSFFLKWSGRGGKELKSMIRKLKMLEQLEKISIPTVFKNQTQSYPFLRITDIKPWK